MKRYEAEWIEETGNNVEGHAWVTYLIPAGKNSDKEWYCSCGLSLVNGVVLNNGKPLISSFPERL